jgi:hypothetical protein
MSPPWTEVALWPEPHRSCAIWLSPSEGVHRGAMKRKKDPGGGVLTTGRKRLGSGGMWSTMSFNGVGEIASTMRQGGLLVLIERGTRGGRSHGAHRELQRLPRR